MTDATRALPGNRHDEPSSPSPAQSSVAILVTRQVGHFWKADPGQFSKAPKPKTHTRTPEACLSHPETCFSQAMKIVHFGLNSAVRISGRICSENVGNPGIYYVALQLMTLRFALCSLCLPD